MKAVASFPHTQRKKAGGYQAKDNFQFMLMVLPTLVLLLLFHYLPMFGVVIAFQDFSPAKGFFGSQFVGLKISSSSSNRRTRGALSATPSPTRLFFWRWITRWPSVWR